MRILSLLIFCTSVIYLNQQTNSPHGADFKVSCKTCHSPKGWQLDKAIYSFNHNKTKMPLVGQHSVINCRDCHLTLVFKEAKTECNQCHTDIHQATTGPDCSRCHTPSSWLVNNINEIHQRSRFPLLGAHRTADCIQCHISESLTRFDVIGVNCVDCHRKDYLATTNPNHVKAGMSQECALCHPMTSFQWNSAGFDHSAFPLTQGHGVVKCADCHANGVFTGASTVCYSCHQKDFLATTNPNHSSSKIQTTCQDCHSLAPGWKPATFDHNVFPLKLGHATPACVDCHTGGNYTSTSPDCYSCHQPDYLSSKNPSHSTLGLAKTCQTCHTLAAGWKPASLDHSKFPLTMGHSAVLCADCHKGNYTSAPTDCYSCHQQDFVAATSPNHAALGFVKTCLTCHTMVSGWKPANFNHGSFPLTLGHSAVACDDCHKGNYTTTPTTCYSCHQQDFLAATNPNHSAAGFVTTCQTCHTTAPGWTPASFNHGSFPLTLGHSTVACNDCHKGNYTTTSTACYSCHQQDFVATTNPNHASAGFLTTCQTCHGLTPGWKPTTFNHNNFPLTLGHAAVACNDCHKGNYTTTTTDCYTCHTADYNNSTNPNHKTLAFSTVCIQCHTTTPGWKPAKYSQHDALFPIYSGRHLGKWTVCSQCHPNAASYLQFDCITCHQGVHRGKNYTNTQCYSCHPKGNTN